MSLWLPTALFHAGVEALCNRMISLAPKDYAQAQLIGKVIAVQSSQPQFTLYFIFHHTGLMLMGQTALAPDVTASFQQSLLQTLTDQDSIEQQFAKQQIQIEGDLQVLQRFAQFLQNNQPSLFSLLEPYFGGVLAYKIEQGLTRLFQQLLERHHELSTHVAELALDEYQWAVHQIDWQHHAQAVQAQQQTIEQLSSRLNQLLP